MMIQLDENVSRTPVGDTGWVKVRNKTNSSIYFISADGRQVSRREFEELRRKFGDNIPASAVRGMTTPDAIKNMTSGFIADVATRPSEHPETKSPPPPTQATTESTINWQNQQQQQQQQQQDRGRTTGEVISDIVDALPDPPTSNARSTPSHPSAKQVEKSVALGISVLTSATSIVAKIPELCVPDPIAVQMSKDITWLLDRHKLLDNPVVRAMSSNEEALVWTDLGVQMYAYLSVAAPAVKARIDLMKAETEFKKAQTAYMRQQSNGNGGGSVPRQHQQYSVPPQPDQAPPSQNGAGQPVQGAFMPHVNRPAPPGVGGVQ
jgi:hypothetical protein